MSHLNIQCFLCAIVAPADYSEFSGGIQFTPETRLWTIIVVSAALDDTTEDEEIFLLRITDVATVCQFEVENNASTVTIRDGESESLSLPEKTVQLTVNIL